MVQQTSRYYYGMVVMVQLYGSYYYGMEVEVVIMV